MKSFLSVLADFLMVLNAAFNGAASVNLVFWKTEMRRSVRSDIHGLFATNGNSGMR